MWVSDCERYATAVRSPYFVSNCAATLNKPQPESAMGYFDEDCFKLASSDFLSTLGTTFAASTVDSQATVWLC